MIWDEKCSGAVVAVNVVLCWYMCVCVCFVLVSITVVGFGGKSVLCVCLFQWIQICGGRDWVRVLVGLVHRK